MMARDNLNSHVLGLMATLIGGCDPPPPAASELFNTLLAEARSRLGARSLVHEIPDQTPSAGRDELILWVNQLQVALSARNP
jgi:hypothetical protein